MSTLMTASAAFPRLASPAAHSRSSGWRPLSFFPGLMRWLWLVARRREILRTLRRVDARLLRDAGIEPCDVEIVVDSLLARWR